MATYYVSPNGSDANNGLGPDASHASDKPWLTLGKLLGASGFASGDTAYVAPGTYRNSGLSPGMTSAVAETIVQGDPANVQGFKDGSGVSLSAGEVIITPYDTDDETLPSHTNPTIDLNGRDYLTFRKLTIVGGRATTATNIRATAALSTNIKFQDCNFLPGVGSGAMIYIAASATNVLSWVIERCTALRDAQNVIIRVDVAMHTAEWDFDFIIRNCLLMGGNETVYLAHTGTSTNLGYGLIIRNNTILFGSTRCLRLYNGTATTMTNPGARVENNILLGGSTAAAGAGHTSQVSADYNYFLSGTPRSNITAGANDVSNGATALMFELLQSIKEGRTVRFPFMPMAGTHLAGFGNATGAPTDDFFSQSRPGVGSNAVGAMERNALVSVGSSGGYIF